MRLFNMLRKIMDCFVDILDRVFDARWDMVLYALTPAIAHR